MPIWKHTLNVADIWAEAKKANVGPDDLANGIADRLAVQIRGNRIRADVDTWIERWREWATEAAENDLDFDDFDNVWDEFYNWADSRRVWVKTSL